MRAYIWVEPREWAVRRSRQVSGSHNAAPSPLTQARRFFYISGGRADRAGGGGGDQVCSRRPYLSLSLSKTVSLRLVPTLASYLSGLFTCWQRVDVVSRCVVARVRV